MKFEKLTRLKNIIKLFINLIKVSKMSTINIKNLLLYVTVFKACKTLLEEFSLIVFNLSVHDLSVLFEV